MATETTVRGVKGPGRRRRKKRFTYHRLAGESSLVGLWPFRGLIWTEEDLEPGEASSAWLPLLNPGFSRRLCLRP